MKKILLGLVLLLAISSTACAGGFANTTALALGANVAWHDGTTSHNPDFEGAANGAMSLSPHISAVGSVNYGFERNYWRSTAGGRVTATDVDNQDFSVGLGIQYHFASLLALEPNEWCPDVAVGIRPLPKQIPALALVGLGWYGLTTERAGLSLGARYRFNI